jgi:hypothetical protein
MYRAVKGGEVGANASKGLPKLYFSADYGPKTRDVQSFGLDGRSEINEWLM